MKRHTNILSRFRPRRSRVGRAILALFVAASLTAGASPCPAMNAPSAAANGDPVAVPHEHTGATGHEHAHGAAMHDGHDGTPPSALAAHLHARPMSPADASAAHHPPGHCPHCPQSSLLTHSTDGSHRFCAVDDATSNTHSGASLTPLPHALPFELAAEFSIPSLLRPPDIPFARVVRAPSRVALNLRHCVFLI